MCAQCIMFQWMFVLLEEPNVSARICMCILVNRKQFHFEHEIKLIRNYRSTMFMFHTLEKEKKSSYFSLYVDETTNIGKSIRAFIKWKLQWNILHNVHIQAHTCQLKWQDNWLTRWTENEKEMRKRWEVSNSMVQ